FVCRVFCDLSVHFTELLLGFTPPCSFELDLYTDRFKRLCFGRKRIQVSKPQHVLCCCLKPPLLEKRAYLIQHHNRRKPYYFSGSSPALLLCRSPAPLCRSPTILCCSPALLF